MSLIPFLALSRSPLVGPAPYCESCGALDDLVLGDHEQAVVFCGECSAPISSIPFPEYYLDIGGESG